MPLTDPAVPAALLEGIQDPFYTVDASWRYTSVNQAAVSLMGVPREALLGQSLWALLSEAQHDALSGPFYRVMSTRQPQRFEVYLPGLDLWEDIDAFPLADGIGVLFRDITPRKTAELREQALTDLSRALARAVTEAEVLEATLTVGFSTFGAFAGHVYRLSGEGEHLILAGQRGFEELFIQPWQQVPLTVGTPITDTVRDGRPRFLTETMFVEQYPAMASHWQAATHQIVTLPLQVAEQPFGVIGLTFQEPGVFSAEEQRFLQTLADLCAGALERSRLSALERARFHRQQYLVEISDLLTSTLEPKVVLHHLAHLAVGHLADWCTVFLPNGDALEPAVVAHIHPEKIEALKGALHRWPIRVDADLGAGKAFRTGQPELIEWIDYEALRGVIPAEVLEEIERSCMRSVIDVPLIAQGRVLGVLEFVSTRKDRRYTQDDVNFAFDLAKRAAAALDNALLHEQASVSERRFRSLVETSSQMVWQCSLDGVFTEPQTQWEEFTGQADAQYRGWGWLAAVHPADQSMVREAWTRSVETQQPYQLEYRLKRRDGQYRVMRARAELVRDNTGVPREWMGVHQDVTERHQAQAALREREARYRALVEHAVVGVALVAPDGTFLEINPACATMLGRTPAQLRQLSVLDVTYPEDRAETTLTLQGLRSGEMDAFTLTKRYLRPDGSLVWSSSSMSAVRSARGEAQYFVAVLVDITEQQRLQEELLAWQKTLEEQVRERTLALIHANQELEAFAYSVSHDLRAPVRHITGYLGLARRALGADSDPKVDRYLSVAEGAAERMDVLINAMLTLAKTSMQPLRQGPVDLNELVHRAQQDLESAIGGRHVRWEIAPLPRVIGDHATLQQVIMNLLSNAVKYTTLRDEAVIRVWAEENPQEWEVFVQDNGAGFDPKYQQRLFGVFQRLHRAVEFEGIGVGLANVRRIVQRHGGRVWAHGKPDEGALFAFSLPCSQP
ncbi:PAS domain S-box protein [Deinococcus peraridilitoris]|uniref:histidine kinase n=1 Tax=Deinococcus peraridilitoris (strain DSM 19664 / LMG 22246 / CIP 109416 / KR-200) TaxID=937777 RepID=L0A3S4_DEIPD|nr:PAS domain S-box protein [Deinococcus peraridilitoris]AFZ67645.1 PAS domain S-box [Deinococcus peraridilitoris DSM 19664]